ncbi:hypothetical protein ACC671_18420 [Rhizobium ruizarguesonis]
MALRQTENLDIDILSARAFIWILETDFGVENAADIWMIIKIGAGVSEHDKPGFPIHCLMTRSASESRNLFAFGCGGIYYPIRDNPSSVQCL